jgi:hypothetical protein
MSVKIVDTELGKCYAAICDEGHGLLAMAHISEQWAHEVLEVHDAVKHPSKFRREHPPVKD